jgi:hypothetical protein
MNTLSKLRSYLPGARAGGGRPGRRPSPTPRNSSPTHGQALRLLAAVLLMSLNGCIVKEEDPHQYPYTNLGGFVTLDNAPINGAMISFCSKDIGNGQVVVTNVIRGRYIAEKVPLGRVLAVISGTMVTGRKTRPGGPEESVALVPEKYRAGFELEVKEDSAQVDFRMSSQ